MTPQKREQFLVNPSTAVQAVAGSLAIGFVFLTVNFPEPALKYILWAALAIVTTNSMAVMFSRPLVDEVLATGWRPNRARTVVILLVNAVMACILFQYRWYMTATIWAIKVMFDLEASRCAKNRLTDIERDAIIER